MLRPILVVDDDAVSRHVLVETLSSAGMQSVSVSDGADALAWLEHSKPCLILLDLIMPGADGYSVLRRLRRDPSMTDVPVVVLTALDADEDIRRIFAEGADDYVHKPFRPTELIARLKGQLRLRDFVERLSLREKNAQRVVELTQTLASTEDIRQLLSTLVCRIAELVRVDRCSIVLVSDQPDTAYVVATSDDASLQDLPISLGKYPEIRQVMQTGEALVLYDAPNHPLLASLEGSRSLPFQSVALVPLLHEATPHGVIFMRSRSNARFDDEELALVRAVANTTSIALSNARVLQSLRDQSEQSAFARLEAERRVQLFQRYADFFESAAEGMMVANRGGQLLFANPRAREITGFSANELTRMELLTLFEPEARSMALRLLRGFEDGIYPRGVDMRTRTKTGGSIILNISFSSVLHEDNAILLTFRDVTIERQTAVELKQTKEFLERVIDSSVDAIISTDIQGRILLFNRAAARIFDWPPFQVIDRMNIAELYPKGEARRVLRCLLNPVQGGWGRLEGHHVNVRSRQGETIPMSLSAAFIVESGRPVGMVGIFTDLRERLRMEQRLEAAQEELRIHERQAIVAELAGAAAHELNQPLTSIIGYAELIRRSLPQDVSLSQASNIILGEAERMATIVRRIGQITRYETKSYVGDAKILDLDRATNSNRPPQGGRP